MIVSSDGLMKHNTILKRVPDDLLDGLPASDQAAIKAQIGQPVRIVPDDDLTHALCELQEIEFTDAQGAIHTLWVDNACLIAAGIVERN